MSTTENALTTLMPALLAIPSSEVISPNMPVATFVIEMESLKETYTKDTLHYAQRKIDTAILAGALDGAVAGLRAAEIAWTKALRANTDATAAWKELQKEAYELRAEAEASLEFILPEDSDARRRLAQILEGTGHADMIFDLGKLAMLCREFTTELSAIAFTPPMIERLDELYRTLADVYGKVSSEKGDQHEARVIRDRAFVYCKGIERHIKKAAKLVLRKEPELLKRYRSGYQHKLNIKKKKSDEAQQG